jgi:hypothetical protein
MAVVVTAPAGPVDNDALIPIQWAGVFYPISIPGRRDWIGLYLAAATDEEPQAWAPCDGNAAGTVNIYLPPNSLSGSFNARLFSGHTLTKIGTSANFTVNITSTPPTLTGGGTVSANSIVTLTWGGISDPKPTDYIVLLLSVLNPGPDVPYTARVNTDGNTNGSVDMYIPNETPPGTYTAWLFRAGDPELGTKDVWLTPTTTFIITDTDIVTITLPGGLAYTAGDLIEIQWANLIPEQGDFIGMYRNGFVFGDPLQGWITTNGLSDGSVMFQIPPETPDVGMAGWWFRLYRKDGTLMATSNIFTVAASPYVPPPTLPESGF